ncbi:hypothetical protein [Halomarina oriensis]|uniref:Uncharacterized protein n=1 Tax=Halomarina oriensis TaxID=671145 RepID=A0A6B0GGP5_9EURY|nr:hypothetical protein [Halomarina oriensis]MWG33137.1 hypothetical protein [Halomarina oriensis]
MLGLITEALRGRLTTLTRAANSDAPASPAHQEWYDGRFETHALRSLLANLLGFGAFLAFPVWGRIVFFGAAAFFIVGLIADEATRRGVLPLPEEMPALQHIVFAPAHVLHEATHAGFARAFGGRVVEWHNDDGVLGVDVTLPDETPAWGIVLVSIGPTLVGAVWLAFIAQWGLAATSPTISLGSAVSRIVVVTMVLRYAIPSKADLAFPLAYAVHLLRRNLSPAGVEADEQVSG